MAANDTKKPSELKNDVAAFASSLGFASKGAAASSDFSDFAPAKAKVKISGNKKAAPEKIKPPEKKEQAARKKAQSDDADEVPAQKKLPPREWNFGVPRPGSQEAKNVLGSSSATAGKSLLVREDGTVWFEASALLPPVPISSSSAEPDFDLVEKLRQEGEKLLEAEASAFERELEKRNSADFKWLQQVKRSGTTADKVAAMTLMIRDSVIANLKSFDILLSWVQKRKGGKDVVRQAIEALQELCLTVVLPDRKLKYLEQQPVDALPEGKEGRKQLLMWCVEDAVKRRYNMLVTALEECTRDNLEFLKEKATKTIYELLSKKPEAEARLLTALTNKLGDPSRKVASNAGFLLGQLLVSHPKMKPIVVREVERFMFRPGLQERARYYAIVFLNQMVLSHKVSEGGSELAKKLIDLYFTVFRMVIEGHFGLAGEARKAQEARYKIEMRKFKQQQAKDEKKPVKEGKAKAAAKKPPKPPKKAVAEEMDARMLGALITGVRRAFPYVDAAQVEPLVEKSGEQLFRIAHVAPFTVGVQALMLLFQLMSSRNALSDRFYRALYSVLLTDGPTTSTKAPMFLSMLYKSMKGDVSVKRVAAMTKRLLQVAHVASPNFACAALLMISEVLKAHPALWAGILQPEDAGGTEKIIDAADDDDGAAKKEDADKEDVRSDGEDEDEEAWAMHPRPSAPPHSSPAAPSSSAPWPMEGCYDMRKREPIYCHADRSCWWELVPLASHSHPSVAAMARTLLGGQPLLYDGDPLKDHTLTAFLDKFILKKPKAHQASMQTARGSSLMQPQRSKEGDGKSAAEISAEAFAALAESNVDPADLFFHKFYNLSSVKSKMEKKKEKREKAEEDEADSDAGEEANEEDIDSLMDKEEKGVDDELGDPDAGEYDYAELAGAMGGDEGEDEGEEDDEEGDEGEMEDEEDEEQDDELEEEEEEEEEEDVADGEDDDDDFVLAPGAAQFLAASRKHSSSTSLPEAKTRSRKKAAAAAQDDEMEGIPEGNDDIPEDLNVLDLPSPSDDEQEDDNNEEEEEEEELRPRKSRRTAKKGSSGPLFASADDYEHLFKEAEEEARTGKPVQSKSSQPKAPRASKGGSSKKRTR